MSHEFWQKRWQEQNTGWNTHGPNRLLPQLWNLFASSEVLNAGGSVWVPGCGHAHDAAWIADRGMRVTATDIADEAVAAATEEYGDKIQVHIDDALLCPIDLQDSYDGVYDRAMLCALEPAQRAAYIESISYRLKAKGIFFAILFEQVENKRIDQPPYALSLQDVTKLLEPFFHLGFLQQVSCEVGKGYPAAKVILGVWVRKEKTKAEP